MDGTVIVPETTVVGVGKCVGLSKYTVCRCCKVPAAAGVLLRSKNCVAVFVSSGLSCLGRP